MKKIKTILITILLGALGSALWETVLKGFFLFLYNQIVLYALNTFSDSFYSKVSHSISSFNHDIYAYIIMIFLVTAIYPNNLYKVLHSENKTKTQLLNSVVYIVILLSILYNYTITMLTYSIATDTLDDIEIISPYISDLEYKTLKSEFYQMDSKTDYNHLIEQIENILDDNGLTAK